MNKVFDYLKSRALEQTTWQGIMFLGILTGHTFGVPDLWLYGAAGVMGITATIAPDKLIFKGKSHTLVLSADESPPSPLPPGNPSASEVIAVTNSVHEKGVM